MTDTPTSDPIEAAARALTASASILNSPALVASAAAYTHIVEAVEAQKSVVQSLGKLSGVAAEISKAHSSMALNLAKFSKVSAIGPDLAKFSGLAESMAKVSAPMLETFAKITEAQNSMRGMLAHLADPMQRREAALLAKRARSAAHGYADVADTIARTLTDPTLPAHYAHFIADALAGDPEAIYWARNSSNVYAVMAWHLLEMVEAARVEAAAILDELDALNASTVSHERESDALPPPLQRFPARQTNAPNARAWRRGRFDQTRSTSHAQRCNT